MLQNFLNQNFQELLGVCAIERRGKKMKLA